MKRLNAWVKTTVWVLAMVIPSVLLHAQDKAKIIADSKLAKTEFIARDGSMKDLFSNAYGYVIFPNIGKGALIVGGAGGNGAVYHKGKLVGMSKLVQATIGAQAGGEIYREVIFFETREALDRFKSNKLEFTAEISAVAARSGASANAKYSNGVLVFTQEKAGLLADVSVGGQKFSYKEM